MKEQKKTRNTVITQSWKFLIHDLTWRKICRKTNSKGKRKRQYIQKFITSSRSKKNEPELQYMLT